MASACFLRNWGLVSICFWATFAASLLHAVEPSSTLVLYNINDPDSVAISDYYKQARPGVRSFGLDLSGLGEQIAGQTYLDEIREPLLDQLASQPWGSQIDTFVTTKGLPLRIDVGLNGAANWGQFSSLESELTRIDAIGSIAAMGEQSFSAALVNIPNILPANPYYLGPEIDLFTGLPLPYGGPAGFDRSDPINENIRLASRLDGYTRQNVFDMIDRAQTAYLVPSSQSIIVDDHPSAPASAEAAMADLALGILPSHNQLTDYDATNNPILTSATPVIGYVSHGVHSGLPTGVPGQLDKTGYIVESLNFELADGAIFHTYESFNAFSFDLGNPGAETSQGQVAQWIAAGGTAGLGNVQEPTASKWTITNEDVFFDMMLSGYTLAEAAWGATRQLSFVNAVVGDPLMRWKPWIPGDVNLDGFINSIDAGVVFGNWGASGLSFAEGDLNEDNVINALDAGILFANWPALPAASFAAVVVPEPTSIWIALHGLCGMLAARRRPAHRNRCEREF